MIRSPPVDQAEFLLAVSQRLKKRIITFFCPPSLQRGRLRGQDIIDADDSAAANGRNNGETFFPY